jgi:hypothetical protein
MDTVTLLSVGVEKKKRDAAIYNSKYAKENTLQEVSLGN